MHNESFVPGFVNLIKSSPYSSRSVTKDWFGALLLYCHIPVTHIIIGNISHCQFTVSDGRRRYDDDNHIAQQITAEVPESLAQQQVTSKFVIKFGQFCKDWMTSHDFADSSQVFATAPTDMSQVGNREELKLQVLAAKAEVA